MLYSHFNRILIDGKVIAEHDGDDDYASDYSDSEHLIHDDDAYTREDIIFYT